MCEIVMIVLLCKHIGEMMRKKGRDPIGYQVMAVLGWIGGEITGAIIGAIVTIAGSGGNEDAAGVGAVLGALVGVACAVGIVYAIASSVSPNPNYQRPQYGNYQSPYGSFTGPVVPSKNPYAPPQNPFADPPAYPQQGSPQGYYPQQPVPQAVPQFTTSAAPSPAPQRVRFSCPSGHLLEDWSTAAGQKRRCPHCSGIAVVPSA